MNHSFKFIVRPNRCVEIEITSLLQYCALKNIMESSDRKSIGLYNLKKSEGLDVKAVLEEMKKIYA